MNYDLSTQYGRIAALKSIENSFLNDLRINGLELSDDAICTVESSKIELGIKAEEIIYFKKGFKMAFGSDLIQIGSEIELYSRISGLDEFGYCRNNEINFGSSGSFDPSSKECYWRTIHAASVLKNWSIVCQIVNFHCQLCRNLTKDIQSINAIIK